jgi:protein required for attachment to host cells
MARKNTWALVTNGVRARLLRGLDDGTVEAPIELVSKASSTHLRDLLSDKAGRSFASTGTGQRSAMEPGSDPVLRDMQDFAAETLGVLEGHLRAGDMTHLAIFAAPKMLGVLRSEMPSSLQDAIILEADVNLINLPEAELRAHVISALNEARTT